MVGLSQNDTKPICLDEVQLIVTNQKAYAFTKENTYEDSILNIEPFVNEEMCEVFRNMDGPDELIILNEDLKPVLNCVFCTEYLALSPNFFGKGYSLFGKNGKIIDLEVGYWEEYMGSLDEIVH